jgi:hypothetical protein
VGVKNATPKEAKMFRRKHRILKSLVLGLAVAAVAAPSAFGEPRGLGNPLTVDAIQQSSSPDDRSFYRGSAPIEQQIVSPDDRAVFRGVENPSSPVTVPVSSLSPDDRSLFRGVETPSAPVSVIVSAKAFQWSDAGLGAASTLAFVLLLGAGTLMIRHQRRRIAAY